MVDGVDEASLVTAANSVYSELRVYTIYPDAMDAWVAELLEPLQVSGASPLRITSHGYRLGLGSVRSLRSGRGDGVGRCGAVGQVRAAI